jgi:hypothetical protein
MKADTCIALNWVEYRSHLRCRIGRRGALKMLWVRDFASLSASVGPNEASTTAYGGLWRDSSLLCWLWATGAGSFRLAGACGGLLQPGGWILRSSGGLLSVTGAAV